RHSDLWRGVVARAFQARDAAGLKAPPYVPAFAALPASAKATAGPPERCEGGKGPRHNRIRLDRRTNGRRRPGGARVGPAASRRRTTRTPFRREELDDDRHRRR